MIKRHEKGEVIPKYAHFVKGMKYYLTLLTRPYILLGDR
jgi:hypothetical protein